MILFNYYNEKKIENDLIDNLIQNFICREFLGMFMYVIFIYVNSQ